MRCAFAVGQRAIFDGVGAELVQHERHGLSIVRADHEPARGKIDAIAHADRSKRPFGTRLSNSLASCFSRRSVTSWLAPARIVAAPLRSRSTTRPSWHKKRSSPLSSRRTRNSWANAAPVAIASLIAALNSAMSFGWTRAKKQPAGKARRGGARPSSSASLGLTCIISSAMCHSHSATPPLDGAAEPLGIGEQGPQGAASP